MDQGWSQDELRQIGEQRESWCTVDSNALRIWCRPERKHAQQAFRSDVFSPNRNEQTEPRCTFQVNAPTHRERRHYPEKQRTQLKI
ncbi:protein SPATA45 homolog [Branchiostoma floridae x Branchiostoma belcheri]